MRPWAVACILVATTLAGCTSPSPNPAGDDGAHAQQFPLVLRDDTPTRDDVLLDSRDERRSNLRAPGFPLYAPADAAMLAFMEDQEIGAGALAVIRDGKLLYANGYGTLDGSTATPPDAMFRINREGDFIGTRGAIGVARIFRRRGGAAISKIPVVT